MVGWLAKRYGVLGSAKGSGMSMTESNTAEVREFEKAELTLVERLSKVDTAYRRQDRINCELLIEELYAHFDAVGA